MNDLNPHTAKRIIEQLGSSGQPPEYGVQYFSAGLDPYLRVIDEEYLSSFIKDGGSAFKLVVGIYGGGKTHFLYCVRNASWEQDFAVSYVSLKSGGECPFDKLDLVYKAILNGLLPPVTNPDIKVDEMKGIVNFLRHWYGQRLEFHRERAGNVSDAREAILEDLKQFASASVESISFRNAIRAALRAVMNEDEHQYSEICQWLKGECPPTPALKRLGITHRVDKTTAFSLIRSLGQTMRLLGYSGLVVLLDEAERVPSLGRGQREQLLSNLREFIDECGQSAFQGIMVFYAVPDRNFLEGRTQIYEALRQRLSTMFEYLNPSGVVIQLDEAIGDATAFLREVGTKIVPLYNVAHTQSLDPDQTNVLIGDLAQWAVKQRFDDAGYKRLFVQQLVRGLGVIHREKRVPTSEELKQGNR